MYVVSFQLSVSYPPCDATTYYISHNTCLCVFFWSS